MKKYNCFTSEMVMCPYPTRFTASDGTVFQACTFYDVASVNIGVLQTAPDGTLTAHAEKLYAIPVIAERAAEEYKNAYERRLSHEQA